MSKRSWQGAAIRTTITMDRTLYKWARDHMKANGYGNNFSQFLAGLARKEMQEEKKGGK